MSFATLQVAVVGAGPAGLVVSCLLQAAGCRVTVIEVRRDHDNASRATGLRYTTLRLLDQLGLLQEVVTIGCTLQGMQIYRDGTPSTFRAFPGSAGRPIDNLSVRQPALEAALKRRALELGVTIITGTCVTDLQPREKMVQINCTDLDGDWQAEASWVIAADGSRSTARHLLGLSYDGEFEPGRSFVLDCNISPSLDPSFMHYFVSGQRRIAVIPLDAKGKAFKLSGSLPEGLESTADYVSAREIIDVQIREIMGRPICISEPSRFLQYTVSRRLASLLSTGRCFLIGDAAHSCPPNGGWGLNTALADAENLAWKLSGVINGVLSEEVLDSYAQERRAVAAAILNFTDMQRRNTFTHTLHNSDEEEEFLTQLDCDGDMTVALQHQAVWPMLMPGRNVWELAARRPVFEDLMTQPSGAFLILTNQSEWRQTSWLKDLYASMTDAGLRTHLVTLPCDGPLQAALIRPDGIVAVVDVAPGTAITDWVARRSSIGVAGDST